uniref:Peptidase S1 domain-containing protein n=1 Tax=Gopherus evgoodei TaxID=1825980 RepID=A0A8C4WPV3_9SAUR
LLPVFLYEPGLPPGEIIWVQEAKPHSKPYMAYLYIQHGDNSSLCGGFLVSENFVLMAAHCNGDKIIVILGAHDITKQEQSQQVIPVRHAYPHQDYDNKTHNNEIMLLKLEHKAHLKEYVRLIPLPMGKSSFKVNLHLPSSSLDNFLLLIRLLGLRLGLKEKIRGQARLRSMLYK